MEGDTESTMERTPPSTAKLILAEMMGAMEGSEVEVIAVEAVAEEQVEVIPESVLDSEARVEMHRMQLAERERLVRERELNTSTTASREIAVGLRERAVEIRERELAETASKLDIITQQLRAKRDAAEKKWVDIRDFDAKVQQRERELELREVAYNKNIGAMDVNEFVRAYAPEIAISQPQALSVEDSMAVIQHAYDIARLPNAPPRGRKRKAARGEIADHSDSEDSLNAKRQTRRASVVSAGSGKSRSATSPREARRQAEDYKKVQDCINFILEQFTRCQNVDHFMTPQNESRTGQKISVSVRDLKLKRARYTTTLDFLDDIVTMFDHTQQHNPKDHPACLAVEGLQEELRDIIRVAKNKYGEDMFVDSDDEEEVAHSRGDFAVIA